MYLYSMGVIRLILFFIVLLLISGYAGQVLRTLIPLKWVWWLYWMLCVFVLLNLVVQFYDIYNVTNEAARTNATGFYLILLVFQILVISFLVVEDLMRIIRAIIAFFFPEIGPVWIGRRKFISQLALSVAALPVAGLIYGILKGKYNYKVIRYELYFDALPENFDGFQLTQISDFHCGSFDNYDRTQYGIDLINEQQSDVIFFTGDMVNNRAAELDRWQTLFATLKAKEGIYSVLGNHDYGDYVPWRSPEEKTTNMDSLIKAQKQMGFKLLLNAHDFIEKDGQRLAIIGVENWGAGEFVKNGDLSKAMSGLDADCFKILLSHDPSHWELKVKDEDLNIPLTLSGHTHGMQFGIEIPGKIKWSPVKWRYPYWAGMYKENNKFLHVNRGFGYLLYPGRLGMWPEISVITLKKTV
jgi:predicted MPP superfamily phosphohydrolase